MSILTSEPITIDRKFTLGELVQQYVQLRSHAQHVFTGGDYRDLSFRERERILDELQAEAETVRRSIIAECGIEKQWTDV